MSEQTQNNGSDQKSYFVRVFTSDTAKKGAATALAGLVVAAITEAIFPSES